jgi:hypothetical protein
MVVLRERIEQRANNLCEYCHAPQHACGYRFHLEHIHPLSRGGSDTLSNRALACASCNLAKADKILAIDPVTNAEVVLYNPRIHGWEEHFHWNDKQYALIGITSIGRATVVALNMNSALRIDARKFWFAAGLLSN